MVSDDWVQRFARERFYSETADLASILKERIQQQDGALHSGVGFVKAVRSMTRAQWCDFVSEMRMSEHFPGMQGYGFLPVDSPEGDGSIERIGIGSGGLDGFGTVPPSFRELYIPVTPEDLPVPLNQAGFGFDQYAKPSKDAAMAYARDTGEGAITGKIHFTQGTDGVSQPGFLMYMAVYASNMPPDTLEARRAALIGYMYSPYLVKDLMQGLLGQSTLNVDFEIFDGAEPLPQARLYDSRAERAASNAAGSEPQGDTNLVRTEVMAIAGHLWTIVYRARGTYISTVEAAQPILIGVSGLLLNAFLFLTLRTLANQRQRANEIAAARTADFERARYRAERLARRELTARKELQRINENLQTANNLLGRFTSIAAHDLRAPLRRMEAFVQILSEDHAGQIDADGLDVLERMGRNSKRMANMVDSLLNYSKCGSKGIERSAVNVRALFQDALASIAFPNGDAEIDIDIAPEIHVSGDPALLLSVAINLLGNAFKFRSEKKLNIQIYAQRQHDNTVTFFVEDNGIGIEPAHAEQVFDMFCRLHNEDEYDGTGIGLAICQRIILDHGGRIWVDKYRRRGTRIVFTLPMAAQSEIPAGEPQFMPEAANAAA